MTQTPATDGPAGPPATALSVLVADDDPVIRQSLKELLTLQGHRVVTVADGRQLVELCRAATPDLVLTDLRIPGVGGLEAAREVSAFTAVPFVIVSGYRDVEALEGALRYNVMAYLLKPLREEDLATAVKLAWGQFARLQAARREAEALRQALEERKLVERAKGAVVKRARLDEDEAYRRLRLYASDRGWKLTDAARAVLAAEEVFRTLEGTPVHAAARGRVSPPQA